MKRPAALATGFLIGVALAGIATAALLATVPDRWRSEPTVWGASLAVIGACVGIAYLISRREVD